MTATRHLRKVALGAALLVAGCLALFLSHPMSHSRRGTSERRRLTDEVGVSGGKDSGSEESRIEPAATTGNDQRQSPEGVRPAVAALLYGDPEVDLRTVLDAWERRVRYAEVSGPHLTEPTGRLYPLRRFLGGNDEHPLLEQLPSGSQPEGAWMLLVLTETLINNETVSSEDKRAVAEGMLVSCGVLDAGDSERSLRQLYAALLRARASLREVREVARLVGPTFTEVQAREFVRRQQGWRVRQDRITGLREVLAGWELNKSEASAIRAELHSATEEKRVVLQEILDSSQSQVLYGAHSYDSDEYWQRRLPTRIGDR